MWFVCDMYEGEKKYLAKKKWKCLVWWLHIEGLLVTFYCWFSYWIKCYILSEGEKKKHTHVWGLRWLTQIGILEQLIIY